VRSTGDSVIRPEALARPAESLNPAEACALASELGSLARWWLRPEVLVRAAQGSALPAEEAGWWLERPRLSGQPGACWVLFRSESPGHGLLRDAFLLPLQWAAGRPHSRRLPPALSALADDVLRVVRPAGPADYGLQLGPPLERERVNLGRLELRAESGWAPLAAGLILLTEGGEPDPQVWATGCWDARAGGITAVDGLAEKLALAREHGVREFFVPAAQRRELPAQGAERPTVGVLTAEGDPRLALRAYLAALEARPPAEETAEGRDRRAAYFLRLHGRDQERARRYYREDLLRSIARHCRAQVERRPRPAAPVLVTIASGNPELIYLAAEIVRPRRCVVLHTPGDTPARQVKAAETLLAGGTARCPLVPVECADDDALPTRLRQAVSQAADGSDPQEVVLDLTPGTKLMSLSLALDVAREGNWLLYLRQDYDLDRRVNRPFGERPLLWPAGRSWEGFAG
jgi:hypothetical protein